MLKVCAETADGHSSDAGDCPAPLTRLYASLRLPRAQPQHHRLETLVRGSRRFLNRSMRRLLHARGLFRSVDDSGRELPTPASQASAALLLLSVLLLLMLRLLV